MLRIVKLNLYNYKLFKEMHENWSNYDNQLDQFFSDYLKVNLDLKPAEIIQILQKQEKNRFMEINPATLYFLFDTTENAYIGLARVSFVYEDKINKDFNIEMKINPKFKDNHYETNFIDLLCKVFVERNKTNPIFRIDKNDNEILDALTLDKKVLIKSSDNYYFYQ